MHAGEAERSIGSLAASTSSVITARLEQETKAVGLRLVVSGKGKVQADQLRVSRASVGISGVGNAALHLSRCGGATSAEAIARLEQMGRRRGTIYRLASADSTRSVDEPGA